MIAIPKGIIMLAVCILIAGIELVPDDNSQAKSSAAHPMKINAQQHDRIERTLGRTGNRPYMEN